MRVTLRTFRPDKHRIVSLSVKEPEIMLVAVDRATAQETLRQRVVLLHVHREHNVATLFYRDLGVSFGP